MLLKIRLRFILHTQLHPWRTNSRASFQIPLVAHVLLQSSTCVAVQLGHSVPSAPWHSGPYARRPAWVTLCLPHTWTPGPDERLNSRAHSPGLGKRGAPVSFPQNFYWIFKRSFTCKFHLSILKAQGGYWDGNCEGNLTGIYIKYIK